MVLSHNYLIYKSTSPLDLLSLLHPKKPLRLAAIMAHIKYWNQIQLNCHSERSEESS